MSARTGGCLCGAVRFEAREVPDKGGICHCEMCRRWTGSALLGITVPEDGLLWQGEVARYQSSDWAERGFCPTCGTGVWFRVTQPGEWSGTYEIPVGLFDDPNGFELSSEIYIDHKPDSYEFSGQSGRKVLTRDDCVARFPALAGDGSGGGG